jgi:hypothetical protein
MIVATAVNPTPVKIRDFLRVDSKSRSVGKTSQRVPYKK